MNRMLKTIQATTQCKGLFWITDEGVLAFPYDPDEFEFAKSRNGLTYTHKKLWPEIAQKYRNKPYNYYPRGRVDVDNKGRSVIYVNPNITDEDLHEIRRQFEIIKEPIVKYDNSNHYKCHLDAGWRPDR